MEQTERTSPVLSGLEQRISVCFEGGQRLRRELRLTDDEARYLAVSYPVRLRPMGEQWYEINFQGAINDGN